MAHGILRWAVAALMLAFVAIPTVAAHANYLDSDPAQGSRLVQAPNRVEVVLTENVDPAGSGVAVHDEAGGRVDVGDLLVDSGAQPRLSVSLPADLANGSYRVKWWALSSVDQHVTRGSFGFAVGNFSAGAAEQSSNDEAPLASVTGRLLYFVGMSMAVGATLFVLALTNNQPMRFLARGALIGGSLVTLGALIVLVDAGRAAGVGVSAWTASTVLRDLALRVALALGAMVAAFAARSGRRAPWAALAAVLAALAFSSARYGHASSDGLAAIAVDGVHFLATTAWVGGLAMFTWFLFRGSETEPAATVELGRRFSRAALVAVLLMATTGILLGVLILGLPEWKDPFGWTRGTYGAALLGKIVLAATMVGLAGINRWRILGPWLREPLLAANVSGRRRFGKFVAAEATIGVVVLALASILTATAPSYASDIPPFEARAEGDSFYAILQAPRPPHAGEFSEFRFFIASLEDDAPVHNDTCGRARCLQVEIVEPGHIENETEDSGDVHKGGEHRILEPLGGGWWVVTDVLFIEPGHYELMLEIQTEYVFFDAVSFHIEVEGDHAD